MIQITEKEVIKRLNLDNPWWEESLTPLERLDQMPRRQYFEPLFFQITQKALNRAIVLMGPRRVGKTVLVYHSIIRLLKEGVLPKQILYLSVDTPIYTGIGLEQLLNLFLETHKHHRNTSLYIFFDEIQYLKDWEIHLKSLVDTYPSYRFTVTGSAAAALKMKSQESGAGRFRDFTLPPLTFYEYIQFKNLSHLMPEYSKRMDIYDFLSVDINLLNQAFINYLNYGGYPETLNPSANHNFIKEDIIDKVLLRDLPSLYGIRDVQELYRLFMMLAYNSGNELSLEKLSQSSGVAKNTLKNYIEYLEAAYLIKRIYRIDQNAKTFQRDKSFKIYLVNPSMRSALFGDLKDGAEELSAMVETAVFSQWIHSPEDNLYYANWGRGEVDMVHLNSTQKPIWAIEIKWSDATEGHYTTIKSFLEFIKKFPQIESKTVLTKSILKQERIDGHLIEFMPVASYLYVLGRNLMEQIQNSLDTSAMIEDEAQE